MMDEVLKALEEEISRVEHQVSNATSDEQNRWKKYLKHLEEMRYEIPLLGLVDD